MHGLIEARGTPNVARVAIAFALERCVRGERKGGQADNSGKTTCVNPCAGGEGLFKR